MGDLLKMECCRNGNFLIIDDVSKEIDYNYSRYCQLVAYERSRDYIKEFVDLEHQEIYFKYIKNRYEK